MICQDECTKFSFGFFFELVGLKLLIKKKAKNANKGVRV
jgi:hypothetical protein